VKSLLGVALLVAALYVLRPLFAHRIPAAFSGYEMYAMMAAFIFMGLLMGALHLPFHESPWRPRARKTLGILLVTLGSFGIVHAILASGRQGPAAGGNRIEWMGDLEKGLSRAQGKGKPVLIDFTAEWCLACKELEKRTFSDAQVRNELQRFVCIRVDMTNAEAGLTPLAQRYGVVGLPDLEFHSSTGERLSSKKIMGFVGPGPFLEHLKGIP
jgi:thiol:disulfide interchange protein DsbD